jgi:hypothetical protein
MIQVTHHTGELLTTWRALELVVVAGCLELIAQGAIWLFGTLVDVGVSVASSLAAVYAVLQPMFAYIWFSLRAIWGNVLAPFFSKVEGWLSVARDWFTKITGPILKVLEAVKQFERAVYLATFGPIIDTISHIQQLLTLLHLTHTALGQALYNALSRIETTIQNVYNEITAPINDIINTIENAIFSVDHLLRKKLFLHTFARDIGDIWRYWWHYNIPALTDRGATVLDRARKLKGVLEWKREVAAAVAGEDSAFMESTDYGRKVFDAINAGQDPPALELEE